MCAVEVVLYWSVNIGQWKHSGVLIILKKCTIKRIIKLNKNVEWVSREPPVVFRHPNFTYFLTLSYGLGKFVCVIMFVSDISTV